MWAFLSNLGNKLRGSLWFIPSLLAVTGIFLGILGAVLDARWPGVADGLFTGWLVGGVPATSEVLSVIAAGVITVTGVAFSVTIVTLSLASSQYGSRLLRTFMRDRGNQYVLGTFIATFLYCLVGLLGIDQDADSLPRFILGGAILLVLASIAALIFFVHHTAKMVQADSVLSAVARELERLVDRHYPRGLADAPPEGESVEEPDWQEAQAILAWRSGYVESVDVERLAVVADEHDLVIGIRHRPGQFVIEGTPVMDVWPKRTIRKRLERRLMRTFYLGAQRTEEQDVEFAIDQMVEVAVRALSPGINDPQTAISAVDRLAAALCQVGRRPLPSPYRFRDGRLRVVVKMTSYEGLAQKVFDQIRQNAAGTPAVLIRLLDAIRRAATCTGDPGHRQVLRTHANQMLADGRRQIGNEDDLAVLEARHRDAMDALADPA